MGGVASFELLLEDDAEYVYCRHVRQSTSQNLPSTARVRPGLVKTAADRTDMRPAIDVLGVDQSPRILHFIHA